MSRSLAGLVCLGSLLFLGSTGMAQNLFVSGFGGNNIYELFPNGAQSNLVAGLDEPYGLAFNSAGILFEADYNSGTVYKIMADGTKTVYASDLHDPAGLAFDRNGNLFVANNGNGEITEIATNGAQTPFVTGIDGALGLAFDRAGNLFVASTRIPSGSVIGTIFEISTNGTQSTFASGGSPVALAFDGSGNLYAANALSNNITKFAPDQTESIVASLNTPEGLAFDSRGNLFVTDGNGGQVLEVAPGGVVTTNVSGLAGPVGLAFAPQPAISGVAAKGAFQLTVAMSSPYDSTVVQASTNLVNWVPVYTNTPPFAYTDSTATAQCRFYRAFLGQ